MRRYNFLTLVLGLLIACPLSVQAQSFTGSAKYVKTIKRPFNGRLCSQTSKFAVKPQLKVTLAKLSFKDGRPFATLNGRPASGFEGSAEKFALGTSLSTKGGSCERYVSSGSFTRNSDGSLSGLVNEGISCSQWNPGKRSVTSYLCEDREYTGIFK